MHFVNMVAAAAWFHGAVVGLSTAAAVDYHAFRAWKRWQDAITYDWNTATFRWLQGFIVGAAGGGIIGGLQAWLS